MITARAPSPLLILLTRLLLAMPLLVATAAQAQSPADPYSYTRTSSFDYDATTGLINLETVEPGNVQSCVKTSYLYDAYGNKTSATTANCSGASGNALFTSRTNGINYAAQTVTVAGVSVTSPAGTFPTTATNAKSQSESKSFDPRFGGVLTLTGPNSLTTSWQYDEFGRTVRETRADGTYTTTSYCLISAKVTGANTTSNSAGCTVPSEAPAEAAAYMQSEPRNSGGTVIGPFTRVYTDRAGRKIRSVTEGFDGSGSSRLIVQDTDYNNQGAVVVSTQPYFVDTGVSTGTGSNTYGMSTTVYDDLGRPIRAYSSDALGSQGSVSFGSRGNRQASLTTISYNGLTITTTNDKSETRVEEKNVDGKVVRVTDALGAQLAHQHDAFGNLVATKDALQNKVLLSYDIRGRKTNMTDPDTGLWSYDYNALGELVWHQNANQKAASLATTMAYDVLGRMTSRSDDYVSTWVYDSCTKGIGKLCSTSTTNGVNRQIVYDSLGRPVNLRTDVSSGPSFASAVSYDSNSRPSSQTYPTGLQVNYNYSTKGFLQTLTLATAATVTPLPNAPGVTGSAGTSLSAGTVLWQANAYNAWGKAEQQTYSNGVISKAAFDAMTGRVSGATAGVGAATNVFNHGYVWNSIDRLVTRTDNNGDGSSGAVTDNFVYDSLGRLQSYSTASSAIPGAIRNVSLQYNALGSILFKSDVGVYRYLTQGGATPHTLQNVAGAYNASYTYDLNGNVKTATAGGYRSISYTSFNLPDAQNGGLSGAAGGANYKWKYDENHQRLQETRIDANGTRVTWMLHPDNAGGLGFENEIFGGATSNRHYLTVGGTSIGVLVSSGSLPTLAGGQTAPTPLSSITLVKVEYWHKDHLGSLVATTDHGGAVTGRFSYDPFGKRRVANGIYDANGTLVIDYNATNGGSDRGYTGHEHLDDVGVIHMNGRLFDPTLGIFMQGDPVIQDPMNLQNFNRYGYCYNNPMTCTDPSGQVFLIDDFIYAAYAIVAIWSAEKLGIIDAKTARSFTAIAVTAGFGAPTTLAQAATSGFIGGAIATGNIKGALQGAFAAGMFYGAGNLIGGKLLDGGKLTYGEGIAMHGVVGCVTSVAGGGKCGPGALSAAFSKAMAPTTANLTRGDPISGAFVSAVVGGTGSALGGGKFANGAQTGAFGYLNNWLATIHRSITNQGALAAGMDGRSARALAQLVVDVDRLNDNGSLGSVLNADSQRVDHSFMHSMCEGGNTAACVAATADYVERSFALGSMQGLAQVLHAEQDYLSPSHQMQRYNGHVGPGHIFDDATPGKLRPALVNSTTNTIVEYNNRCGGCILGK